MVRLTIFAGHPLRDNKKRIHERQRTAFNCLQSLKLSRIFAGSTKKPGSTIISGSTKIPRSTIIPLWDVMRRSRWLAAVGSTINV